MKTLQLIQRSLDLIEERLCDSVSIAELARCSGMSLWHFQRTFSAVVGESVGRYLRQRRIAEAAKRLVDHEGSLLELALDYQFESHEAFTRAFKSELSVTPSEWREGKGKIRYPRRAERLSQEKLNQRFMTMILQPELVLRGPATFIGFEGSYISAMSEEANNLQIIPRLWDAFFERLAEIETIEPGVSYGLAENPEAHGKESEHPDEALYLASAKVAADSEAPDGMSRWESPGGLFAKFEHEGPASRIGETMAYIYGRWLPESEFSAGEGADLIRIDSRFNPTGDDSVLDILIPISKKE